MQNEKNRPEPNIKCFAFPPFRGELGAQYFAGHFLGAEATTRNALCKRTIRFKRLRPSGVRTRRSTFPGHESVVELETCGGTVHWRAVNLAREQSLRKSQAKGKPTYPKPITEITASRSLILAASSVNGALLACDGGLTND